MSHGLYVACQAPLSTEFSRQEYWSGLPFPSPIWNILDEMGIPDLITCLLRNLYAEQEATVRTGHGTMDWFQTGKGVHQGCILSPCLFNLYAEYIMRNVGWMKHKLESKLLREITVTSDKQMTITLMAENEEELKSLLMKVKEESEKAGLKLSIQNMKIWPPVPTLHGK